MPNKMLGKKRGMTQFFDKNGHQVPCTVIEVESNFIVQIKKESTDGYNAIQIAAENKKKNISKPIKGHFDKAKVETCKYLFEERVESVENFTVGQELKMEFGIGEYVDVMGTSKGKGFQGVMKKYGFSGGPAAHGSGFHRHAGSTGMRSTPGRCFKGGPRASRMGGERKTIESLEVLEVDSENNMIVIKGSIPGNKGSVVFITKAKKK